MTFELFISSRLLSSKRKVAFISLSSLLSIIGIAVGVMALIIVISVMTGYEEEITSRILEEDAHIVLFSRHGGPIPDYRQIITAAERIHGVVSAEPFIYSQIMLHSSSGASMAILKGIQPDSDRRLRDFFQTSTPDKTADACVSRKPA